MLGHTADGVAHCVALREVPGEGERLGEPEADLETVALPLTEPEEVTEPELAAVELALGVLVKLDEGEVEGLTEADRV